MRSSIQVLLLSFLFYGTFGQGAYNTSSLESILKDTIGSMNATIVDMQRTMARIAELETITRSGTNSKMQGTEDEASSVWGTIHGIGNCTLEPTQRAKVEEEGRRKLVRELTDQLIPNPRAKLYTGLNYSGNFESYNFKASTHKGGCYELNNLKGKIKSVNTEGTCVRIFSDIYCSSWSQALYPGSSITIDDKLEGVVSVGPCVSNEFEYATLTMSGNPPVLTVNKGAEEVAAFANVPDLVPDFWMNPGSLYKLNNTEPITHYKLGQGGRLQGAYARIYTRHILSPDVAEVNRLVGLNQSFFADLGMIPLPDEPSYVVPLELGGPGNETYNVFAQDKGQAAKYRALLVPMIKQHIGKYPGPYVRLTVALQYPDSSSKRPAGVWYYVWRIDHREVEITYGYFPNVGLGLLR